MRYRKQADDGDYQFGTSAAFLVNSPETVAQAVMTRMKLLKDEWFVDKREGLDQDRILGAHTTPTRDQEIQQRILGTPGVNALVSYASNVENRDFTVAATIDTIYGQATINEVF